MMIKKEKAMELLKEGATIEFTIWGSDYPIFIRHNAKKIFDKINKKFYNRLWKENGLKLVKRENLSCVMKLKKSFIDEARDE